MLEVNEETKGNDLIRLNSQLTAIKKRILSCSIETSISKDWISIFIRNSSIGFAHLIPHQILNIAIHLKLFTGPIAYLSAHMAWWDHYIQNASAYPFTFKGVILSQNHTFDRPHAFAVELYDFLSLNELDM